MKYTPESIRRVYITLTFLNTLSASFIWGVNTLFLLDAGLTAAQAFAANAFFTLGEVIFEVPTGVVADTAGRRLSFLLGTLTLAASTLLYLLAWHVRAPFWAWAATSILLGLGFTFFSGATDAWLVDALHATGYTGKLETVFAKGQIATGAAMLTGSVAGGYVAQLTNLGTPYLLRSACLLITLIIAYRYMKDLGFKPATGGRAISHMRGLLRTSIDQGLKRPAVRWMMLAGPFTSGVGIYGFYAMQPHLLNLYGNHHAYGIAGLAAAIVAGAQIAGGILVPRLSRHFSRRTTILATGLVLASVMLVLIGLTHSFWLAVGALVVWGLVFAASMPIRSAYLNGLIGSEHRATVLSFDNLLGSAGGVVIQPALGRAADVFGYGLSYVFAGLIQVLALPFVLAARRTQPASDVIEREPVQPAARP